MKHNRQNFSRDPEAEETLRVKYLTSVECNIKSDRREERCGVREWTMDTCGTSGRGFMSMVMNLRIL
jgi:hypothetical protein